MANHCYNTANITGKKAKLDLFEKRLAKATTKQSSLWWQTYFTVLGQVVQDGDVYQEFGSRWFEPFWERVSPTHGVLSGDSAWSPISEFLRKLSEVYGFTIESDYEEGGMDFGGWFDCENGEVTKDKCVSYHVYRFIESDTEFFYSVIEDAEEGYWESIHNLDPKFVEMLSETQKQELIQAINKSQQK